MTSPATSPRPRVARRSSCRLCDGTELVAVLSLAPTPPANAFVARAAVDEEQPRLPLDLWFCRGCGHVQLLDVVDPCELFSDYVYESGTSPVFVSHFEDYAAEVHQRLGLQAGDLVVDVGSNDGTLLRAFARLGLRVLGVDPAENLARRATESGIETLHAFFGPELAARVRERYGAARAVTANNVFAHSDDLGGVLEGVRTLLAPDGAFVFEVSYLLDVIEKLLFDTIYHEHVSYHSVQALVPFLDRHGLSLVDVKRIDTHGGSLRGYARPAGTPGQVSPSVAELVEAERRAGLDRPETFRAFGSRVDRLGQELRGLLTELRSEGHTVAGFGAPAKATTLMHHFGLGPELVDFVVDDSPLKQGLYTPGFHLPVLPTSAIYERRPDYLLVLAWNFAPSIMANHRRFSEGGGHFIVPLPSLHVV